MKTDLLTARLLSAYEAVGKDEFPLIGALSPDHTHFTHSASDGYKLLKHRFSPGAVVTLTVTVGGTRFAVRIRANMGNSSSVHSGIQLNYDGQEFFNNFLITGRLADILTATYISEPIERIIDHPILAGNNITITKATNLPYMTLFVTDRTDTDKLIDIKI